MAGVGTYDLVRQHDEIYYVADELFDKHFRWIVAGIFAYLMGIQLLCIKLFLWVCDLLRKRQPILPVFLMQIVLFTCLFSFILPFLNQKLMELIMLKVLDMAQPDIAFLHDKYNRSRLWLTLYPLTWILLIYWRSNKRKRQQIHYLEKSNAQLEKSNAQLRLDIEQLLFAEYLSTAFLVIRKQGGIAYELTSKGELLLIARGNYAMHRFIAMYCTQISKAVFIYTPDIIGVNREESYIEIPNHLFQVMKAAIKKYAKLGEIVQDIKSHHGLLHLSKIYMDHIDPKK